MKRPDHKYERFFVCCSFWRIERFLKIMSLTVKQRWEIVFLCTHRLGPKLSLDAAAKEIECSISTASHWLETFEETGDVMDKPGRGRKRKTSESEDKMIFEASTSSPEASSAKLSHTLEVQGVNVSAMTIRRRLHEAGFICASPLLKPLLTKHHRKCRLMFARQNAGRDWSKVIFTDETTFHLFTVPRKVWRKKGESYVARTVKHPLKIQVWGCFAASGFGRLFLFKGNMNAERLTEIYEEALLPSALDLFGDSQDPWFLQEDNDPKHMSRLAKEWRRLHSVNRIPWPSQSPDLNPMENVWGVLEANVAQRMCRTEMGLKRAIKEEWANLSEDFGRKLVESVPKRLSAVIDNKGDYILY